MFDLYRKIEEDVSLLDRKAVFALLYTAVALTCTYYFKNAEFVMSAVRGTYLEGAASSIFDSKANNLPALGYWVLIVTLFYVAIPVIAVKLHFRERLSDYGLKLKAEHGFWKLLLQCSAVMLPIVYLMSHTSGFSAKYPFFKVYNGEPYFGRALLIWELIYFVQFFGLEFFFRGFLVHSLRPALGIYSIFVMTIPYCMIHFGKPLPETFAAIFAGVFLGWLSYKNGNIWLGLALHCMVAFSMDILALLNKGLLF